MLSVNVLPGNQTHDFGVASAVFYQLSFRGVLTQCRMRFQIMFLFDCFNFSNILANIQIMYNEKKDVEGVSLNRF